jgi:hypothetical protein
MNKDIEDILYMVIGGCAGLAIAFTIISIIKACL